MPEQSDAWWEPPWARHIAELRQPLHYPLHHHGVPLAAAWRGNAFARKIFGYLRERGAPGLADAVQLVAEEGGTAQSSFSLCGS